MITRDDTQTYEPNSLQHLSPVEHIHKYFRKLKQDRLDILDQESRQVVEEF